MPTPTKQYFIPEFGYINEAAPGIQYLIPEQCYVNETESFEYNGIGVIALLLGGD